MYHLLKWTLWIYNIFYFKNITIYGRKHIPNNAGIIYSANHQAAFLDSILIGVSVNKPVFSTVRADVFKNWLIGLLKQLKTIPIYRLRDGFGQIKENYNVFEQCYKLLGSKRHIIVYSEGKQHEEYFLQPISKGSSRIAINAKMRYPNVPIFIVPVGINYAGHHKPRSSVQLVFGKPIDAKHYINSTLDQTHNLVSLKEKIFQGMKSCLWIPEKDINYPLKKKYLRQQTIKENFCKLRQKLRQIDNNNQHSHPPKSYKFAHRVLLSFFSLPNLVPLWILQKLLSAFDDKAFHGAIKYVAGCILFPFWWLILALLIYSFLGSLCYSLFTVIVVCAFLFLRQYCRQYIMSDK